MTGTQERKRQERLARRRRIQDAARGVFIERGYAGASIEQIARACQLSIGAIYLYFKSKEDLYVSLIEESLVQFDAEMTNIRNNTPVGDRLVEMWELLANWAQRDSQSPRIVRFLSQPGVRPQLSPEVKTAVGAGLTRLRDHLSAAVADGVGAGIYHAVNPREVGDAAWALLLGALADDEVRINLELSDTKESTSTLAFGLLNAALGAPARPQALAAFPAIAHA